MLMMMIQAVVVVVALVVAPSWTWQQPVACLTSWTEVVMGVAQLPLVLHQMQHAAQAPLAQRGTVAAVNPMPVSCRPSAEATGLWLCA